MRNLESFKRMIQLSLSGVGLIFQILIYRYFYYNYFHYNIRIPFWGRGHYVVIFLYVVLLFLFSKMYGGTRIGYLKNVEVVFSQVMGTLVADGLTYFQISLLCYKLYDLRVYLRMTAYQVVVACVWVIFANFVYSKIFRPRELLIVHGSRPVDDIINKFNSRKDKYIVKGTININRGREEVKKEILSGYGAIVIWDIPTEKRNELLKFCYGNKIRVYIMPKISDVIMSGAEQLHIFDSPLFLTREYTLKYEQRVIKRLGDIFLSLLLIILSSPFMLLTAIAVKLYDGGPVLYKQVRCTYNQREFKILKFRSMRTDAEKDGVARLATANDSRITPVGKFIRKCRLDELPQLFNILKGDMSFIGPRPERPEIIEQYLEVMPEFAFRMKVKAGLAGYAQVYGKYNTTPYDKLKLDLCYIEQYSVWLDLKLMLLTVKILFMPDATEGVASDQITALRDAANASNEDAEE